MTALFKDGSPICTVTFTELAQLAYLQAIQRAQFIRQLNN